MGIRLALKVAIIAVGKSQRQIAADCGLHENRFSAIVCGWTEPRVTERQAIAAALGKSIEEIFDPPTHERSAGRVSIGPSSPEAA